MVEIGGTAESFLCGEWQMVRRVWGVARLRGKAVFLPAGDGALLYQEAGTLVTCHGDVSRAWREYIFVLVEGGFDVYFAEVPRRLFHAVRPVRDGRHTVARCEHLCGDDRYRTLYRWKNAGTLSICHRVTGPRKDYTMVTVYQKIMGG